MNSLKEGVSPMNFTETALVGEIGALVSRLQIIEINPNTLETQVVQEDSIPSTKMPSFSKILKVFLMDVPLQYYPNRANLGAAGAVIDNNVKITNLVHWPVINGEELGKEFDIKFFKLFNNFELCSLGVLELEPTDYVQINDAVKINNKMISVCGVGTGLGMSMLFPTHNDEKISQYRVFPSEGGHAAFAPVNKEQQQYYQFLKTYFPDKTELGIEYTFTRPAIPYMYPSLDRVLQKDLGEECFKLENFQTLFPQVSIIFNYGMAQKDPICEKVLDFFWEIYFTVIGDIAIRTLCHSGLYLVGSFTYTMTDYMLSNQQRFLKSYKGNRKSFENIFKSIPIYIVKQQLELQGAIVNQIEEKNVSINFNLNFSNFSKQSVTKRQMEGSSSLTNSPGLRKGTL